MWLFLHGTLFVVDIGSMPITTERGLIVEGMVPFAVHHCVVARELEYVVSAPSIASAPNCVALPSWFSAALDPFLPSERNMSVHALFQCIRRCQCENVSTSDTYSRQDNRKIF